MREVDGELGAVSGEHVLADQHRPAVLDDVGLESALRDAVGRLAAGTTARVEFHGTMGARRLRPDYQPARLTMLVDQLAGVTG